MGASGTFSLPRLLPLLLTFVLHCCISPTEVAAEAFQRGQSKKAWKHASFDKLKGPVRASAHTILHYQTETPLHVPLEVNVLLLGFNGDGAYRYTLNADAFRDFLQAAFPTRRLACLETLEELEILHDITYNVVHVSTHEMLGVESTLKSLLVQSGTAFGPGAPANVPVFDVEATSLEPVLDQIYASVFGVEQLAVQSDEVDTVAPTAIMFLNFDKERLKPRVKDAADLGKDAVSMSLTMGEVGKVDGGFLYRYKYNGAGHTQAWQSHSRYLVVDLSAGPCMFGRLGSDEGAVTADLLPRVQQFADAAVPGQRGSEGQLRGELGAVVASAVEHVIAPDVHFENLDVSHRVLVALSVLRSHAHYDPFKPGHKLSINVTQIEGEAHRLMRPGQDLVFVKGLHSLHEHERLSIAVSRATLSESEPQGTRTLHHFQAKSRDYVDGALLVDELRHSSDVLAEGLLGATHPDLSQQFFEIDIDLESDEPGVKLKEGFLAARATGHDAADSGRAAQRRRHGAHASKARHKLPPQRSLAERARHRPPPPGVARAGRHVARAYGTQVVPVFVLSLAGDEGWDAGLLMDGETTLEVAPDTVVVLQTPNTSIPLSYVSENVRLSENAADPTRAIIAGLASVLGPLAAPTERVSVAHRARAESWLWAVGHHPFGPFSNTPSLSLLALDTARRSSVYSRVDVAIHGIRQALQAVQVFASEYMRDPLGTEVTSQEFLRHQKQQQKQKGRGGDGALGEGLESGEEEGAENWLDKLYTDPEKMPHLIPVAVVKALEESLKEIEEILVQISSLLYDHQLTEAHTQSYHLLTTARSFHDYVETELTEAREAMRCCTMKHQAPFRPSYPLLYGGILIAGFIIYFVVIASSSFDRS